MELTNICRNKDRDSSRFICMYIALYNITNIAYNNYL